LWQTYIGELSREKAARCEENARQAEHPTLRASYLRAAALWNKLAENMTKELERLKAKSR
jgi:hypothetical protein